MREETHTWRLVRIQLIGPRERRSVLNIFLPQEHIPKWSFATQVYAKLQDHRTTFVLFTASTGNADREDLEVDFPDDGKPATKSLLVVLPARAERHFDTSKKPLRNEVGIFSDAAAVKLGNCSHVFIQDSGPDLNRLVEFARRNGPRR
jgi:hypothetical protein